MTSQYVKDHCLPRVKITLLAPVAGSIVVIWVTLGLFINAGNSAVSQTLPGLRFEPMTARTDPDAPAAY